jgi:uncharacterized protein Yka (UPF0111/DUF47 family)
MEEKREIIKPFRMTKQEAQQLKEQAEERNLKESAYLRFLLSQKPNDYPEIRILLKELIHEVSAVGNNINQITRNYNSKLYRIEDREMLIAYMKKLNQSVREVTNKFGN